MALPGAVPLVPLKTGVAKLSRLRELASEIRTYFVGDSFRILGGTGGTVSQRASNDTHPSSPPKEPPWGDYGGLGGPAIDRRTPPV
jgi:hypothetical protein